METNSCHKSQPWHSTLQLGKNPQFPSSEEWRVSATHIAPQLLRPPPKKQALKSSSSEHQHMHICIHEFHRTIANKVAVVKRTHRHVPWLSPQGSEQRNQQKCPSSSFFLRSLTTFLTSYCWGSGFQLGASKCWLWSFAEPKRASKHFWLLHLACSKNNIKSQYLPARSFHTPSPLNFTAATQGRGLQIT